MPPHPPLTIITGGGTGIGSALAKRLASHNHTVLIIGRRSSPLLTTKQHHPNHIKTIVADITTPSGRQKILHTVGDAPIQNLIHNAGTLEPTKPLVDVTEKEWRNAMSVNVDAPLFLTQALVSRLVKGGRVLHVSSGAARRAYKGWGAYCTTKAALNMMYRVLRDELAPRGVFVGSVRPGVVDTPMQDLVRAIDPGVFPDLGKFRGLKERGELMDPDEVAIFLEWLLFEVGGEEFSSDEWDIRDDGVKHRWKENTCN